MGVLGKTLSRLSEAARYYNLMPWILGLIAFISLGFIALYVRKRHRHLNHFKSREEI